MENNSTNDISVFTFARGSQLNSKLMESESYGFVMGIINTLMKKNGVETPKVGLVGTKEDVCCFIAGLINYQLMCNIDVEYFEGDTIEFDPDVSTELQEDELG